MKEIPLPGVREAPRGDFDSPWTCPVACKQAGEKLLGRDN